MEYRALPAAEFDALTAERDDLRAALKEARPALLSYAANNPTWIDLSGKTQDPCGIHAAISRLDALLREGA